MGVTRKAAKAFNLAPSAASGLKVEGYQGELPTNVINIYGDIVPLEEMEIYPEGASVSSVDVKNQLDNMEGDVLVRINSPGGIVFESFAIYNYLREYSNDSQKVVTMVDGLAASAATQVLMAGDVIIAHELSSIMMHRAMSFGFGNVADLAKVSQSLQEIDDTLVTLVTNNSNLKEAEVRTMLEEERTLKPEEALEMGIINHIAKNPPKRGSGTSNKKGWLNFATGGTIPSSPVLKAEVQAEKVEVLEEKIAAVTEDASPEVVEIVDAKMEVVKKKEVLLEKVERVETDTDTLYGTYTESSQDAIVPVIEADKKAVEAAAVDVAAAEVAVPKPEESAEGGLVEAREVAKEVAAEAVVLAEEVVSEQKAVTLAAETLEKTEVESGLVSKKVAVDEKVKAAKAAVEVVELIALGAEPEAVEVKKQEIDEHKTKAEGLVGANGTSNVVNLNRIQILNKLRELRDVSNPTRLHAVG